MKIIVVAMVKNEETFIESSVRYWLSFADQIIVFDHDSKDGTLPILQDLIAEFGDRLILFNNFFSMGFEYKQMEVTNAMVAAAFNQFDADLVMPLDTDEFPYLNEGGSLREFLCGLSVDTCYRVFWMPFAPPSDDQIDSAVFAPMAFCRKKTEPMTRWEKTMITRQCYYRYNPILCTGNHTFLPKEDGHMPQIMDLSPRLYYAHYMCRGKSHYVIKNLHGWLTIYSDISWQPGTALQYQLASEHFVDTNGEISSQMIDWYALTSNGMTGECMEDIQNKIENVDPHNIYPDIPIKYTPKHIRNFKPIVLLFESSLKVVEQYREKCISEKSNIAELQILRSEFDQLSERLSDRNAELQMLRSEFDQLSEQLSARNAELQSILSSRSWKMTEVLRNLASKIRKIIR